jgi:predicted secreted protein
MGIVTLIAVYFVLWWLVIFMVLPFGVRRDADPEHGNDPGAPRYPMLMRKFLWTSVITAVLTFGVYALDRAGLTTLSAWYDLPEDWPR